MANSNIKSFDFDKKYNVLNTNNFAAGNSNTSNSASSSVSVESLNLSQTKSGSAESSNKTSSSGSKKRTDLIQGYIDKQVIDPNEEVGSIGEMEEKLKRDLGTLEERVSDAKTKLDSLKKEFENANSDISVFSNALPDDEKWMARYGMTKKEFQEMIDKMSDYVGMLNQTIKSNKEMLKKMPYLEKMDTKDFKDYVSNYKPNWQSFVNYDEVAEQYSFGHNLKNYSKLDGKEVDWMAVIEYMMAKDKDLVIGEHDELRATYLKYEAMDESQRLMYHYLFEKEGMEAAQEYLNAISDDINKNIALNRVERKVKSMASSYKLDENGHITQASIDATLENLIASYGAGFDEALKGNYAGLFKYGEDNYTIEEYEQMYMLQYLNQNGMLKGAYDSGKVGGTISNIAMSMIMYTGATYLSGGTALAGIVPYLYQAGNVALSVGNAGGEANHYALVNGATEEEANQYTASIVRNNMVSQVFSAIVSRGVASTAQFSSIIKGTNNLSFPTNVAISAANTVIGASTATWEVGQEQDLKSSLLHEKPLDVATANDQMVSTFVSNIIMGALSEAPGLAMSYYSIKSGDKVFEFSSEDCLNYFRENPDATAQDFVNSYTNKSLESSKSQSLYENGNNSSSSTTPNKLKAWKDDVVNSKYQKVVDGITFSSDTMYGLDALIGYYNKIKKSSNSTNDYYLSQLSNKDLIITNIVKKPGDCSFQYSNIVFFNSDAVYGNKRSTFFHETGHFLDCYVQQYNYTLECKEFVDKMKAQPDVIKPLMDKFKKEYDSLAINVRKKFNDNKDYYVEKLRKLNPNYDSLSDNAKEYMLNKMYRSELNKVYEIYDSFSDIFDAITNGQMYENYYPGHGKDYYSSNEYNVAFETLAQVSVLYNNNKQGFLYKYFPADLVAKLIYTYESIINLYAISEKIDTMIGSVDYISDITNYLDTGNIDSFSTENGYRNFMTSQSKSTLVSYLNSYGAFSDFYHSLMNRMSEDTLRSYLSEYVKTGNLDVIKDAEVKNYVKYIHKDTLNAFMNLFTDD